MIHDRYELPYRYNYLKKLILDDVFIHENVLDLSKVQSFIVTNLLLNDHSTRLFNSLKNRCLRLILLVSIVHVQRTIIRLLHWNKFEYYVYLNIGKSESKDQFNWSRLFPLIKRLIAPINSKSQIQFLIYQFKNIISGFFPIDTYYMDKQIKIKRQWLEKHLYRSRGENIKNFIFTFFMD